MLIQNVSANPENKALGKKPKVLIIQSLKNRPEDPEITLGLGQIVDTSLYIPHPDEKIKNNPELKFLEREGLIKFLTEYPKEPSKEEKAKISVAKAENENKDKLSDIKSSSSLTFLEDIIDNSDDVNEVRAAMIRLQQIDGDMIENPEIKQNNPII